MMTVVAWRQLPQNINFGMGNKGLSETARRRVLVASTIAPFGDDITLSVGNDRADAYVAGAMRIPCLLDSQSPWLVELTPAILHRLINQKPSPRSKKTILSDGLNTNSKPSLPSETGHEPALSANRAVREMRR